MRPADLFRPASVPDVACIKNPNSDELIKYYELAPLEVGIAP